MENITVHNPYALDDSPLQYARKPLRVAGYLVGAFFGGGLLWASIARLDSAAHAPGKIVVEKHTQPVQHLEGGIIDKVLVKDGDHVKFGDTLMVLNDVHARSELNKQVLLKQQIDAGLARLRAELNGYVKDPEFSADTPADTRLSQLKLYTTRRDTYLGKQDLLQQQIAAMHIETRGYRAQASATAKQKALNAQVLANRRKLVEQKILAPAAMLDQETKDVQYDRDIDYLQTQIASANKKMQELKLQVLDLQNSAFERAGTEMKDLQAQLDQVSQAVNAAQDVLNRTVLTSPSDGVVTAMHYTMPGGVVQHSEVVMNIVPEDQKRIIEARINPQDINGIKEGQTARVMLTAYKTSEVPTLKGTVTYIAADTTVDHNASGAGAAPYYTAQIILPPEEMKKIPSRLPLLPGMSADVTIVTGERTALRYILQPLTESFRKGLNEK